MIFKKEDFQKIHLSTLIMQVVAERFPLSQVKSPIAFISKDQDPNEKSGYSRVVVIKEEGAGHYNNTPLFHAFQVNIDCFMSGTKQNR